MHEEEKKKYIFQVWKRERRSEEQRQKQPKLERKEYQTPINFFARQIFFSEQVTIFQCHKYLPGTYVHKSIIQEIKKKKYYPMIRNLLKVEVQSIMKK